MTADRGRDARGHQRGQARSQGRRSRTAAAPSARAKSTDPARDVAYETLQRVATSDAYANLVLPALLRSHGITGRDAAFATELTYGTLRLRGRYDAILERCIDRPLKNVDPPVLDVLRLGLHQLLGMRIPPHAAVSETVALARSRTGAGTAQFVNAILRHAGEEHTGDEWLEVLAAEAPDELTGVATVHSHPLWIVRAMRDALAGNGRDVAELPALLEADNTAPHVTLAARPGLADAEELAARHRQLARTRWAGTGLRLHGGDPAHLQVVRTGRAGVQDEGSQLVTLAFADVPVEGGDERWLDLCAGPGGKAALLAALAATRGARLVANELQPHRARLVEHALAAVPSEAVEKIQVGDGRDVGRDEPGGYDRVLLDAPCTGLGALRRRPESRWRRTTKDLSVLSGLQRELLASALDAVRPGGVVGYVTCSPHLAETRIVVEDVLRRRGDVERLDAPAFVRRVSQDPEIALGERTDVQLWPHVHGTDAMHLTLLRRTR